MSGPWERYKAKESGGGKPWERYAAPKEEEPGIFDKIQSYTTDVPARALKGALGGVEAAANVFGADNPVSELLRGAQEGINEYLVSDTAKRAAEERSKRFEGKGFLGTLAEIPGALVDDPVLLFEALGTAAPSLAAAAATGGGSVAAQGAALLGTGAAMGAGTVKGSIYQTTKNELMRVGASEDAAEAAADEAQSYAGENLDMIALGTALGAIASRTGIEPAAARLVAGRILGKSVGESAGREGLEAALLQTAEKGALRRAATEAVTEGAQGGQEQLASNLALQRQGFDTDLMEGVGSAAALEGTLGGIIGGGFGIAGRRADARRTIEAEDAAQAETAGEAPAGGRPDIQAFRRDVTSRLTDAAGAELSERASNAVRALGTLVSNDIATATPESLDRVALYIQDREDELDAGDFEPDVAVPLRRPALNIDGTPVVDEVTGAPVYEGALAEAKRMVADARARLGAAPVDGAPIEGATGISGTPDVSGRPVAQPDTAGAIPKMEVAPDWFVKFADQFGQSELADNWAKSVLGTDIPSELQTAPILERAATMQAGQQRQLKRNQFDPLVEAIGNTGVDLGDFNYFLWLEHAAERNREIAKVSDQFPEGGAGITTAEAAEGLQQIKDEGLLPKYNLLKNKVQDLVRFNLEEDVKAGLFSEKQVSDMLSRYKNYVPLKGFAADGDMLTADLDEDAHSSERRAEAARAMRAASPSGSVREYRQAFGRGSMPFAPLFNLMQDSEQRVRRRILNKARLPVLQQWKANPKAFEGIFSVYTEANPKKIPVGRDIGGSKYQPVPNMEREYYANPGKYMVVKDNGVPHYIEFSSTPEGEALRRMFENLNPKDMQGAAKAAADINNFLKGMLTYKNPIYLLFVAPLRDFSSAITTAMYHQNLKGSPAYKKNLAARTAFYGLPLTGTWSTLAKFAFTNKPLDTAVGRQLDEMIREGGATLNTRFLNVQEKAKVAEQAIRKMKGAESLSPKDRGKVIFDGLNSWIDSLADLMDMSARFATYRAARDYGISAPDAARLALDSSLNLTRRGEKARSLDLIFPFFGAGVESARKTKRIYSSKGGAKVLGALLVYGALESLWNAAFSGDDDDDGREDYLNLDSSGMRMSRFTIYYGEGADDYVKLPIDPMVGYFKFVGNRIGDLMADTITPAEATGGLLTGAISLMSPLRIPQADLPSAAVAFTPLVGKPIMENILNRNFFGGPIYQEDQFDNAPPSELGRPTTGEGWKWLARTINEVTGGSEAVRSEYGLSLQPEIYRQLVEGWLGGPYQLAKQVLGLKDAEGVSDIPGIKSFVGSGSEYAPQTQYFENSTVIRQIMNRFNKLTPEQQAEQTTKYFMDTDVRIVEAYQIVDKELDRLNKEQRELLSVATSDEDREMVIDHYRAEKNKFYSAFNNVYNDVKRGE